MRCLILDDEPMLAELLALKLKKLFPLLEPDLVSDTAEALQYMRTHTDTAILFLDMQMQEMHGLDVLRVIGTEGLSPAVVVVSGHKDFNFVQSAWKMGARAYITKPVDITELEAVVGKLLTEMDAATPKVSPGSYIDVPAPLGILRIRRDEILYLRASGRRALLVKTGGEHEMLHISLGEAEKLLGGEPFIRAGRFVVLNYTLVGGFMHKEHAVLMQFGAYTEYVRLGRGAYSNLMEYLKVR